MAGNETPSSTPAAPQAPAAAAPAAAAPQQAEAHAPTSKANAAAEKAKKALGNLKNLGALADTKELVTDLASPDRQTRSMARYFIFSVAGIIGVLIAGGFYIEKIRDEAKVPNILTDTGEQGKNLNDFIKKQADEAKRKFSTQSLGTFSIELKPQASKDDDGKPAKRPPGVMDLAEIEIIVECDGRETCDFIEDRMPAVRNEVTSLFTAMYREDLLSRDGKRKLKNKILSRLNLWLPTGKIQNLYFNKLIIS